MIPSGSPPALAVRLPLPYVTLNHAYKGARGGGRLLKTDEAKAYCEVVAWLTREARNATPDLPRPPYRLSVWLYYRDRRSLPDIDGGIKLLMDGLFDGLGENDRLVTDLEVHRRFDTANPRVDVILRTAEEG